MTTGSTRTRPVPVLHGAAALAARPPYKARSVHEWCVGGMTHLRCSTFSKELQASSGKICVMLVMGFARIPPGFWMREVMVCDDWTREVYMQTTIAGSWLFWCFLIAESWARVVDVFIHLGNLMQEGFFVSLFALFQSDLKGGRELLSVMHRFTCFVWLNLELQKESGGVYKWKWKRLESPVYWPKRQRKGGPKAHHSSR